MCGIKGSGSEALHRLAVAGVRADVRCVLRDSIRQAPRRPRLLLRLRHPLLPLPLLLPLALRPLPLLLPRPLRRLQPPLPPQHLLCKING
jgi:hypothetical protein